MKREVIVTGGRNYNDFAMIDDVLTFLKPDLLIQGGATGADESARDWAKANNVECKTYEADWNKYNKSAGPIRNGLMLENHPEAIIVAFLGGKGTANCVDQALRLNRIILRVEE